MPKFFSFILLVTSILYLFSYTANAMGESPVFDKITTNEGLSHNTVYAITQDHKGFLWFGTREGLNRYDGQRIITYYATGEDGGGLLSYEITALHASYDHQLLVGSPKGLLSYDVVHQEFSEITYQGSSLGSVNRIFSASDSSIYICTNKGLFVKATGLAEPRLLVPNLNVTYAIEYKRGVFWVSAVHRLFMINQFGEIIKEYTSLKNSTGEDIPLSNLSSLYKDRQGSVWVASRRYGLFRYNTRKDAFYPVFKQHEFNPLEVNIVRTLCEDAEGRLWIGTETGLFIYDVEQNTYERHTQSFQAGSAALNDKAIYSIYRSKENIMWLGTYFGGVNVARPWKKGFKQLKPDGGVRSLSGKAVSDIMEDEDGNLWIATEDGGVNTWDRTSGTFTYLRHRPGRGGLNVDNVHCLYKDNDNIWIGTFLGGLNKYSTTTGQVTAYAAQPSSGLSLRHNMVYAIHKSQDGKLWIGSQGGLSIFDEVKGYPIPFRPEIFRDKFVYEIYEDSRQGLWICVMNSSRLYYYHPGTDEVSVYKYANEGRRKGQPGVISALEDSKGRMWFGTVDRGLLLWNADNQSFASYGVDQGLPNQYVYGILEDARGRLWVSTNKGISKFNVEKGTFSNYDISDGLPSNQFNFKSAFKDRNGFMYFGSINGLCYFHPDSIVADNILPKVYLSDIKLFNQSIPIEKGGILEKHVDAVHALEFKYSQNVITLEFASINHATPGKAKYAFILEGFEKNWNEVDSRQSATYTNLSPGQYTFRVKAANGEGVWSDEIRELGITILPPFWMTHWAMVVYGLLIIGMFWVYRGFLNYRNREKMAVQIERLEKEKIQEINRHKINFFTYISHEFKTPLTLIMASIDKFLMDRSVTEEETSGYRSIKRNARRLHFLVDQLMEFRKVETDHAVVNYVKGDMVLFLRDTFHAFAPLFHQKNIEYHFNTSLDSMITFFDGDKLEKIVTNLVSNAVKYTTEGGTVELEALFSQDNNSLDIIVRDTGAGIDEKEIEDIFTSFYQAELGKSTRSGSGIGLALVKSLVEFLKGQISIESSAYHGTEILVSLPLTHTIDREVDFISGNKNVNLDHEFPAGMPAPGEAQAHEGPSAYKLLIVEDNPEIGSFLHGHLGQKYKTVRAGNGREALDKITTDIPDVIISDIMMPEMDGLQLCRRVKEDINTSHIPVILLTAKTAMENRLEGLDVGADAYITKPFSLVELELSIKNLLESRNSIKNHFLKFGSLEEVDVTMNNRDQAFLLKLSRIVEENLENSSFNITEFTKHAGVSRSLLHLKLKKLANLSASEFIKTIRLGKAGELLRKTDLTVSEVAYKVGYSDPNYFSRSFKEFYKVNPTEYKQEEC